jgi:hypothetical protein
MTSSLSPKLARRLSVLAAALAMPLSFAATASAVDNFRLTEVSGSATASDGSRATQAAAHPDITSTVRFSTQLNANGELKVDANLRDIEFDLPQGLVGDPRVGPKCSMTDLVGTFGAAYCVPGTQIGDVVVGVALYGTDLAFPVGLYGVEAPPGVVARFGFNALGTVVILDATVNAVGGYHVIARSRLSSQAIAITSLVSTLWGVPADRAHDARRLPPGTMFGAVPPPTPSSEPRRPFITAPTRCDQGPLKTTITVNSWTRPEQNLSGSFDHDVNGDPLIADGCDDVGFTPTTSVIPDTASPDAPTGLQADLKLPQSDDPDGLGTAHLKDVKVTLPEGMTINPASAGGLTACSDAQLGLGDNNDATCPESAKIGTATATTPLLTEPLSGGVFIRSQASNDPESGDMFRMALVLENEQRGVLVKLPGAVRVNETTGRIVTEFANNPQMPVEHINLQLKGGSRAPLATPATCGTKTIQTQLSSWAGHDVHQPSPFEVSCTAGLGGFGPSLQAGVEDASAGAFAPFSLTVAKPDGQSAVNGLSMVLPTGLLAKLKGNLGTQVGTVKVFAGPGANPYMLPGQVFLEGAYGDAPFSLKVVVPAKAGPFDLGEVVVRQKIYVDPIDAHVTVVSDPLPTIVKGVPVRLQRLEVDIDKPRFIVNPTSCAPKTIGGTLGGADGQTAPINVRFQVGECGSLALKPSLGLTLSGKGQTTDGKHPAVTAVLSQPAGQANLKKVRVALPLSLALDPDNANGLCEFVDGSKATPTCPKASIVGTATAVTPILNEPLSGPVYFVKNVRKNVKTGRDVKTLPKLVIPLVGENGVKLTLTGTSDVEDDHLVTTFDNIPDAPVSSFKLNINGGKGGILTVSGADVCKSTQIADQQVDGQNNKAADADVSIQTPSCPLTVISKTVGKTTVKLKVGGLGAGKVTVTGKGIKKTTKTIAKSTVVTITVRRTKARLGKAKVSFVPEGAKKAKSTTATLR